jgi:hypothetical protein
MQKPRKLFNAICVVAIVLGAWGIALDLHAALFPIDPDNLAMNERQRGTYEQIKALMGPWQPVYSSLFTLGIVKDAILIIGGTAAFGLRPFARRLLAAALFFAVVVDGLSIFWFVVTFVGTSQINVHHMMGTTPGSSLSDTRSAYFFGLAIACVISLLKPALEAAAWKYVRSDTVRNLFAVQRSDKEPVS